MRATEMGEEVDRIMLVRYQKTGQKEDWYANNERVWMIPEKWDDMVGVDWYAGRAGAR